jgi:hypothetical protein
MNILQSNKSCSDKWQKENYGIEEIVSLWSDESVFDILIFKWDTRDKIEAIKIFASTDLGNLNLWYGKQLEIVNGKLFIFYQSGKGEHLKANLFITMIPAKLRIIKSLN